MGRVARRVRLLRRLTCAHNYLPVRTEQGHVHGWTCIGCGSYRERIN